jgi:hypothetical protein
LASGTAFSGRNRIRKRPKSFKGRHSNFSGAAPPVAAMGLIRCQRAGWTLKVRQVARHVGAVFRRWANLGPRLDRPATDRQYHEEGPITLVAGGRTGTFAPVHDQRAILAHLPFPTPAALGYSHFNHGGKAPNGVGYFKAEPVSLRSIQKGSLKPNHRRHRDAFCESTDRKILSDKTSSSAPCRDRAI